MLLLKNTKKQKSQKIIREEEVVNLESLRRPNT
jgi:hypothetical protein